MRTNIKRFTVTSGASIRTAISAIDANASGIVLVVDDRQCLLGTATDGDIRRLLLEGGSLETPIDDAMCTDPIVASTETSDEQVVELFRRDRVKLIPVVSTDGTLLGVHLLDDYLHRLGEEHRSDFPAVIMAGGLGTRLRPLTDSKPKPLVEIGGKPILERIINHLSGSGAQNMVITTRYLAEQIEGYFGDGGGWDVDIDYVREEDRLGTAGSLRRLKGKMTCPFLVMNGDILTNFNVNQMFSFHDDRRAEMTVGVRHYSMQVPYGVAEVDNGFITELSEKPVFDFFVNAGIYVVEPSALDLIPDEGYFDITELIDRLLDRGASVASFPIIERWMDIGKPEDVERANDMIEKGT